MRTFVIGALAVGLCLAGCASPRHSFGTQGEARLSASGSDSDRAIAEPMMPTRTVRVASTDALPPTALLADNGIPASTQPRMAPARLVLAPAATPVNAARAPIPAYQIPPPPPPPRIAADGSFIPSQASRSVSYPITAPAPRTTYSQPVSAPVRAQPVRVQPTYVQPTYVQPTYVQPAAAQPTYVRPSYVAPATSTQIPVVRSAASRSAPSGGYVTRAPAATTGGC